jgi:putative transcriptional regulator
MKEKLTTFTLKKGTKPTKRYINLKRLHAMTEAEVMANACADGDNLPLTKEQLAQFKPAKRIEDIDVKAIRIKLGFSQEQFANYFGVSLRTLQDWEQHRHNPNSTARNFLVVVSKEPQAVQRALSGK